MFRRGRLSSAPLASISDSAPLSGSLDELVAYFLEGTGKGPRRYLVGIEHEKLAVRSDGRAVPYEGADGIGALLEGLATRGWTRLREGSRVIALSRGAEGITLEPGGQFELAGAPLGTAHECAEALDAHLMELRAVADPLGIRFIGGGFRPFGSIDDVPWFLKQRYEVMRAWMPKHGTRGHEMMKRTATVQVNLDFSGEVEAAEKVRVGLAVSPAVTALFAASPVTEGRANGWKSFRAGVWLDTDESRCGILPFAFAEGFHIADYARWALDVPMFFVARDGRYHEVENLTFRRFLSQGWNGHRATLDDWALHLSTMFPEVRLKKTIELRGADAGPMPFIRALGALWRGLLDDASARREAWKLVCHHSLSDRNRLRQDVPRLGLEARVGGEKLAEIAVRLLAVADDGLARLPGGEADRRLLEPIRDFADAGRSPADVMLEDLSRVSAGGTPTADGIAKLVDAWELK